MFYKLEAGRVTIREFWWETKLFFWVGILVKLFKIRLRGSTDDLAVDSLRPFVVDESAIPAEMLARFGPALNELQSLGFGPVVWHFEEDANQATRNTLATLLHQSGRTWARVQCRVNFVRVPPKVKFFTTLISKTPGGFIVTGNGKRDMAAPKTHDVERSQNMAVGGVWARHQQRLTAAVQRVTPEQLLDVAEEYHVTLRDFHLARGVFVPLEAHEIANLPPPAPPAPTAALGFTLPPELASQHLALPAPDLMEVATLDELHRLQNKQANWRFSIVLLALSAMLFVVQSRNAGGKQNWEFVAIVVGVLLVHELGHFIAMKLFGYRNLRMFFIPGFGAAVSGRHYNAPAWKKIVVSLMGPLPGILAGAVVLFVSLFNHNDLFYRVGTLAIIVNAFNLIPILPLDGGWVAHAAIFSRHPKLDIGFRVVAALLLLLIGIKVPGMNFLPYIAIAGLTTLPVASKLAMIVKELRGIPELGVSPDSQSIPTDTARIILSKLRDRFKKNLNARLAARHIATVFESLNARPPSAGATVGLLAAHAGGFFFAIIALLIGIGLHGRSARQTIPFQPRPSYAITPGGIESTGVPKTGLHNTVVVRFKDESTATQAFHHRVPPRSAVRFGQTIFVSFSPLEVSDQHLLFNRFKPEASDIFVASPTLNGQVELTCKASTSRGQNAIDELQAYLGESTWGLIPPWAPEKDWPAEQRASQTELRKLIYALQSTFLPPDPESRELWKKIGEAQRSGDTDEVGRLRAEVKQRQAEAEKKRLADLKEKYGHADLIDTYSRMNEGKSWTLKQKRLKEEFGPMLGQWPASKSSPIGVTSGYSLARKGEVDIYCQFTELEIGLPALTRWLFANGVADIHYRIAGVPASDSNLLDDTSLDEE